MSKLILLPGDANTVTYELTQELVTIGRAPENVVQIDDPSVSSRHAQLHLVGEAFHLQDLDSTNGTRVNGETVTSVALREGDRIRFGKVEARFQGDAATENHAPPALSQEDARPAEVSALPSGFANASPFQKRKTERDPLRTAAFAAAAVAIVAFMASLLTLLQMQPPNIP